MPVAVNQHHLARSGQVGQVTLKMSLCVLTVAWCRQHVRAAHAHIKPLGDAFEDAALAGRVTAFKQRHHLMARNHDPVLQFDDLTLQTKEFKEILAADFLVLLSAVFLGLASKLFNRPVLPSHLQLFVIAVDRVMANTSHQVFII